MPIYEYFCPTCNRVFSFLVKSFSEAQTKQATCPKCGRENLKRKVSRFAVGEPRANLRVLLVAGGDDLGGDEMLDDPRVEREMEKLMAEAEHIDENDPRQLGGLMRRMSDITGEEMDDGMEEAIRRLESGEDPEKVEEEMGDVFGDEDGPGGGGGAPSYDDGLYSM